MCIRLHVCSKHEVSLMANLLTLMGFVCSQSAEHRNEGGGFFFNFKDMVRGSKQAFMVHLCS